MSMSDPLGDMLTRIRNSIGRRKISVITPSSKLRIHVLNVLKIEGYILGYVLIDSNKFKNEIEIKLKYYEGLSVIRKITRISKPGRRVYVSMKSIRNVANGLGVAVLSTSKGVIADHEARKENIGGELLCQVF